MVTVPQQNKPVIVFFIFCASVLLLYVYQTNVFDAILPTSMTHMPSRPSFLSQPVIVSEPEIIVTVTERDPVILYYTKLNIRVWHNQTVETGDFFRPSKERGCIITSKRDYLPSINDYDALIFFHWNLNGNISTFPPQSTRRSDQLYIIMMSESPQRSAGRAKINPYSHLFNLTMSYRLDADIVWPYGRIMDKASQVQVAPYPNVLWKPVEKNFNASQSLRDIVAQKKKMISWAVSNCNSDPSKRMDLARSLGKFVQLDIYGKCGKECGANCKEQLGNDYFFYLAFENTLAKDYVSEKPFKALGTGLIPVVYGGANYSHHMPPKSYINAQDFATTRELAEFLIQLSEDTEEYLSYFWWMDHYTVIADNNSPFADLCSSLKDYRRAKTQQHHSDLEKWFSDNMTVKRTIKFS